MAVEKKRRGKPDKPLHKTLNSALAAALKRHDDFIVVFETVPEEEHRVHVMTGKLISPCMLGTLTNRSEIQADEGSTHRILPLD